MAFGIRELDEFVIEVPVAASVAALAEVVVIENVVVVPVRDGKALEAILSDMRLVERFGRLFQKLFVEVPVYDAVNREDDGGKDNRDQHRRRSGVVEGDPVADAHRGEWLRAATVGWRGRGGVRHAPSTSASRMM